MSARRVRPVKSKVDACFDGKTQGTRSLPWITQSNADKNFTGESPPDPVLKELQLYLVMDRVDKANAKLALIRLRLETWPRWDELRSLLKLMQDHGFTRVATALQSRLPPKRQSPGFKVNTTRTLKLLNDLSLDESGVLLLLDRWGELSQLASDMEASGDRIQKAMLRIILNRLTDQSTLAEFADSLAGPLEEMSLRRKQFTDPKVDRVHFLQESPLQRESAPVTAADFARWEQELGRF